MNKKNNLMKDKFLQYSILLLVGFITYLGYEITFKDKKTCFDVNKNTALYVVNNTEDSMVVFLTVGADTNYITDVNRIFGIKTDGMQGSFILNAHDTLYYTSPYGKGFNGNICFVTAPVNCADTIIYPFGINIFEFALNNNFKGIANAQETIDISCVSGVNSKIVCNLSEDNWNVGSDVTKFKSFKNLFIYDNVGRTGVFPYGCDSCTVIKNPPVCLNHKKYSQTQKKNICNVQRDANKKGGKVYVVFSGVIKEEILK